MFITVCWKHKGRIKWYIPSSVLGKSNKLFEEHCANKVLFPRAFLNTGYILILSIFLCYPSSFLCVTCESKSAWYDWPSHSQTNCMMSELFLPYFLYVYLLLNYSYPSVPYFLCCETCKNLMQNLLEMSWCV